MITLGPTDTLSGVAGTASAITWTAFGDRIASTTDNFEVIGQGVLASSVSTMLSALAATQRVIGSISLENTTASPVAGVQLFINGTANGNRIVQLTIPANGAAVGARSGWVVYDGTGTIVNNIITLSGDVSGTGTSAITTTLATVNSNVGSFGSASNVATFTVNGKGLTTAAGNTPIQIAESQVTNLTSDLAGKQATGNYLTAITGDLSASGPGSAAGTLATVNSNVGSFGSASNVATFSVNGKGLTTAAGNTPIQIAEAQVTNLTTDLAAKAIATRAINTTAPLTGGGDLSADRTLGISAATTSAAGSLAALDKKKLNYLPNFVTDYGADPTGTTDIDAAVTAAVAAGVAGVYVPEGVYKCCTTGTHVVTSHLTFYGSGRKDTIFKTNHATNNAFQFRNWGGGFVDCGFDTLVARTGGYCIDMPNSTQAGAGFGSLYCHIERCDIYSQYIAIHTGDHEQLFNDIEIRFPGLTLSGQGGILVDGAAVANDKRFQNLLIQGGNTAGQFGMRVMQAASVTLTSRNDLINCANAFDIIPGNGQSVPSIYASNTFFDNSIIGLNVAPTGTGAVLRCHFTQCWFSSCTTAGVRLNSANIAGVDMLNCDIFGNAIGIEALAAQHWSVASSRLAGNTIAAIRTTAAATHNFDITTNRFGTIASPQFGVNAIGIDILAGTYGKYYIAGNSGLETDTIAFQDAGTIGPTGSRFVENNPGLLCNGASLPPLSSGGAALLANSGRGAVTSGTTETFLMTFRIPARAAQSGQTLRLKAFSVTSAAGVPTWGVKAGAAGTVAGDTTNLALVQAAQAANVRQVVEAYIQVINTSGTNNVIINGLAMGGTTAAGVWVNETVAAEATLSVNVNAVWFITLTCACGTTGTLTIQQAALEVL